MKRDKGSSNRQGRRRIGADGLRLVVISAATFSVLGATAPSRAQDACEMQRIFPNQPAAQDEFGIDVDMSKGVVIAGAIEDDDNGFNAGAAYLFRFDGSSWQQEQKIDALGGGAVDDHFGLSVALEGTTAVIGAAVDVFGTDSGAAYVFELDGNLWTQLQVLTPAGGAPFDQFGYDVDISGDAALIATPGAISDTGFVYVYRRLGELWIQEGVLAGSDGALGDRLGESVAIDGDIAVVGAIHGAGNVIG